MIREPVPARIRARELASQGASPVKVYFTEESFDWLDRKCVGGPFISIHKNGGGGTSAYLYLSKEAMLCAGLTPGDRIRVGVSKAYLAVRKHPNGFILRRRDSGGQAGCMPLVRRLEEMGISLPVRVPLEWVEESGMLVGRLPVPREGRRKS